MPQFTFLINMRRDFLANCGMLKERGQIDFDMNSLASVLASSYTLEEDDFHKGNFGFYLVIKNERIQVVFFKIDNDAMLADSIMSRCDYHWFSWYHGAHAFDITERDIRKFPRVRDSRPRFWPTSSSFFS